MTLNRILVSTTLLLILVGCSTTKPLEYSPAPLSFFEAAETLDRLTMTQRQGWRPNEIEIRDTHIFWDHKDVISQDGWGNGQIVEVSDRYYYDSDQTIMLQAWRQSYYVVSMKEPDGRVSHLYRTDSLENAQTYVDAIHSIGAYYRSQ